MKRVSLAALVFAMVMAGCAVKRHQTAKQYFNEATDDFRSGALLLAVDEYHELLDQYPFSKYNEEAELKIAQAQYLAENYPEAIVAFTDFQRRHPTSASLPLVGYYLGMCYVKQMGTIDRDQSAARNAETYFVTVSRQYPESPFAELAREQLARCRQSLAQHELYVAKFYALYGNKKAEEIRLLTLAARYGDTEASAEGLLRLAQLYRGEKDPKYAALAYQALVDLHPRGPNAEAAHRALEQLAAAYPQTAGADPPGEDPLDVLLAANGRKRGEETYEPVRVPGLESSHAEHGPVAPPVPAMGPGMNPFGRGGFGTPY